MDLYNDFEYLCRICAANTKGKYNSVPECVYIFKTIGLKQKIEKHLYLGISEADALPKVLCKTCFRQVEATASLSKIAKHTQKVFRDFLLSAGKQLLSINFETQQDNLQMSYDSYTTQNEDSLPEKSHTLAADTQKPPQPPALVPLPMPLPLPAEPRRDEVVLNVSVNDPLTRETQQKMISASQRQRSLPAFPAHTDNRYTPRSIAQRAFSNTTLKDVDICSNMSTPAAANNAPTNSKKYSPPGVINFFHTRTNTEPAEKPLLVPKPFLEEMIPAVSIHKTETAPGTVQKRKQIKITHTNMPRPLTGNKTTGGQVSLLKASQPKHSPVVTTKISPPVQQPVRTIQAKNIKDLQQPSFVAAAAKAATTKLSNFEEVDEQLPPRMIIAAPKPHKNKSQDQQQQQQQQTKMDTKVVSTVIVPSKDIKKDVQQQKPTVSINKTNTTTTQQKPPQKPPQQQQQQQATKGSSSGTNSAASAFANNFDNNTLLGKVIRDLDLLKLIMKALKWPVNDKTLELQMMRLRNSKFMDIMSDTNLLQDTDLTQILGPIIYAAQTLQQQQQQQQQQQAAAAAADLQTAEKQNLTNVLKQVPKNTAQAIELASALTYKLPAETSVQLVPASPESEEPQSSASSSISLTDYKRMMPLKKQKRKLTASDEDLLGTQKIKVKSSSLFEQRKQPVVEKPDVELLKLDENNKQLNMSDESLFDTDDIILMEQQPALEAYNNKNNNNNKNTVVTAVVEKPAPTTVIARPNVKRRKTVIQTITKAEKLANAAKRAATVAETNKSTQEVSKNDNDKSKEKVVQEEELKSAPVEVTKVETATATAEVPATDAVSSSSSSSSTTISSASTTSVILASEPATTTSSATIQSTKAASTVSKVSGKRAQLGQKLLQAIGCTDEVEAKRDSVAQIRFALQRSLKQAQEQRLRKQEADSTTNKVKNETELAKENKQMKVERKEQEIKTNVKRKLSVENDDLTHKKTEMKASVSEENISIPDDVSSTAENLIGRKRGRKSKMERDSKASKTDLSEDEEARSDITNDSSSTNRPTRMSKTLSKYYKGPDQNAPNRRALPSRAARSKN